MWKSFSSYKQQQFIWGGATSKKNEPTKLNDECIRFFNNAATFGQGELQDKLD